MLKLIKNIIQKFLILLVRFYQLAISPYLGSNCRHAPSCSQYTIEAIKEWGPLKGVWMGAVRISRCHPWGTHGYDPVPKKSPEPETGSEPAINLSRKRKKPANRTSANGLINSQKNN